MVSALVLKFISLLLLAVHIVSIVEASVADCFWSSFLCLFVWLCLLPNLGNKTRTELNMLEKVLGLLADITRNLCLLGSAIYKFHITSHKVINFTVVRDYKGKVIADNYGTWLKWVTWRVKNLSFCLNQGVRASTCLWEGSVLVLEAEWDPFSVSTLLENWGLTGTLCTSDGRGSASGRVLRCTVNTLTIPERSARTCSGVHIGSPPAYFSVRCHGIFGLYDAGRLWTFAVWYKVKTGQYQEIPSTNKCSWPMKLYAFVYLIWSMFYLSW